MRLNLREHSRMLGGQGIHILYSGPLWANGIDGMAEMLLKRMEFDDVPASASQSIFSVFVEQINNMMLYSADKEIQVNIGGNPKEIVRGIMALGIDGKSYFVQSGNLATNANAEILRTRIDHLNSLDKKELRKHYKERMLSDDDNLESKGAGLGLIVVARRASTPLEYKFEPHDDNHQFFSMYIEIGQGGRV